jgi:hypothetical protein
VALLNLSRVSKKSIIAILVISVIIIWYVSSTLIYTPSVAMSSASILIPRSQSMDLPVNGDFEDWNNDTLNRWRAINDTHLINGPGLTGALCGDEYAEGVIMEGANVCAIEQYLEDPDYYFFILNRTVDFSFHFKGNDHNHPLKGRAIIQLNASENCSMQVNGAWSYTNENNPSFWNVAIVRADIPANITGIVFRIEISALDSFPLSTTVDSAALSVVMDLYPMTYSFSGGESWLSITVQSIGDYAYLGMMLFIKCDSTQDWWIESFEIEIADSFCRHYFVLESNSQNESVLENLPRGSFFESAQALDSGIQSLANSILSNNCILYYRELENEVDSFPRPIAEIDSNGSSKQIWGGTNNPYQPIIQISYTSVGFVDTSMLATLWRMRFQESPVEGKITIRWAKPVTTDFIGNPINNVLRTEYISIVNLVVSYES